MAIVDHVSDVNGVELHRLSKLYSFPDFVKSASSDETLQPGKLSPTVYADPRVSRFPCHNKAATWLSALYFQEKRAEYHPKEADRIQQRLDSFVAHWGIKAAVDAMRERWTELHKNADDQLPDSDFAFVWAGEDGHKNRHLRIKNAVEVKAAAEWLHKYRDQLPFSDRNIIANKITEKAARYGASLGGLESFVEKQAGRGVCDPAAVVSMLRGRAKLASDTQHRQQIEKLAETVASKPRCALTPDMLVKLAETVDTIDRALNLVGKYTDVIRRPEDVIFSCTYKEAQAGFGQAFMMTSGSVYDKSQLHKIALEDIKALFGDEFAENVRSGLEVDPEKCAEIASTLPLPDAQLFDRMLSESGIQPITVKDASAGTSVSQATLKKLASQY